MGYQDGKWNWEIAASDFSQTVTGAHEFYYSTLEDCLLIRVADNYSFLNYKPQELKPIKNTLNVQGRIGLPPIFTKSGVAVVYTKNQ